MKKVAHDLAARLADDAGLGVVRLTEALQHEPRDPTFENALARVEETLACSPEGPPKNPSEGSRKLAFFGESAAAGYLYAPRLTPAGILAQLLGDAWQVDDHARTNQTLAGLLTTMASVDAADVLVIYTGNNWEILENPEVSPYAPSVEARLEYARALDEGVRGPRQLAERRLRQKAQRTLAAVDRLARRLDALVVVVLPEVDSESWEVLQPPFMASSVEPAPTSGRGAVDGERYAEMALLGVPRATSEVRRLLAAGARKHDWPCVDLRDVFEKAGEKGLFLDYCHLSARGMNCAMRAVTGLLPGGSTVSPDSQPPEPSTEALARLGAAIHAAHRHPPTPFKPDLIERRLREALGADPRVSETFRDLLSARAAPLPSVLTSAQARNLASPHPLGLQHGWRWPFVDADLLQAIARVLPTTADELADRLAAGLALTAEGCELTVAPFLWDPMERYFPENMNFDDLDGRATLRSPLPWLRFCLVLAEPSPIELDLTARLPDRARHPEAHRFGEQGDAELSLNGTAIARLTLGTSWSRTRIRLSEPAGYRGLNCLRLDWPAREPPSAADWEASQKALALGRETDLHPPYGEVASLVARITTGTPDAG